jgi:hypothetical protein
VLIGYGILYSLVALSFVPMDRILPSQIDDAREMSPGVIFGQMTGISIGLLEAMSWLTGPLVRAGGMTPMYAEEGLLVIICVVIAVYSAVQLLREAPSPGGYGTYTFLLLLALTVIVIVRFTMHSWAHFA